MSPDALDLDALDLDALYAQLAAAIEGQRDDLFELRHELHRRPEVSGTEHRTRELLSSRLGLPVVEVADTGFHCRVGDPKAAALGVRTELDALPIEERTGAEFAADNGAMHACGHDLHQAAFVGFLRALGSLPTVPLPVVGIGQPREETYPSGAKDIVEAGVLDTEQIKAMLGLHVHPGIAPGSISTGVGGINASSDEFHLTVIGSGGHGGYPHRATDPVPVAAQLITALMSLTRAVVDPVDTATISVGSLQAGNAANVIPDRVQISGTIRAMRAPVRELLLARVEQLAVDLCRAAGCTAEVTMVHGEPVLNNDRALVGAIDPWLERAGLSVVEPLRSCGADDFSYFAEQVPSVMGFLGVRSRSGSSSLHSADFLPDDEVVLELARGLAAAYVGVVDGRLVS